MTVQSSRTPPPIRTSPASRPAGGRRRGLLGALLTPLVLLAAVVNPQGSRSLTDAESVD